MHTPKSELADPDMIERTYCPDPVGGASRYVGIPNDEHPRRDPESGWNGYEERVERLREAQQSEGRIRKFLKSTLSF